MPSLKWINVSKSVQQPAQAMHIKASETDGNVEIVENLEHQLGTPDEWYETYICLCHSDLRTQEQHDTTMSFCVIEQNAKSHLQWLIPVLGRECFIYGWPQ